MKKEDKINGYKIRIKSLTAKDEVMNKNIINKLMRKIRKLEGDV